MRARSAARTAAAASAASAATTEKEDLRREWTLCLRRGAKQQPEPIPTKKLGEACASDKDCVDGLICIEGHVRRPRGGVRRWLKPCNDGKSCVDGNASSASPPAMASSAAMTGLWRDVRPGARAMRRALMGKCVEPSRWSLRRFSGSYSRKTATQPRRKRRDVSTPHLRLHRRDRPGPRSSGELDQMRALVATWTDQGSWRTTPPPESLVRRQVYGTFWIT